MEIKTKLEEVATISILTHLNPDADTLGTGLGIYNVLKEQGFKRLEIVNYSDVLPQYLDFLPAFHKIKKKMDFEEGLVIACDCGSIDRLGVPLMGREILNIDHHQSNQRYGSLNVVIPSDASASQVAYKIFEPLYPISKDVAICFYTALLSDTQYFTTSSVTQEVFSMAQEWIALGVNPSYVASCLTKRKSLASVRILQKALETLTLVDEGKVAFLYVTQEHILSTGALAPDMEGIVEYATSLVTVEVAFFVMELKEGMRVSLRSKGRDISGIAASFGGGGHKVAAGFTLKVGKLQETIDTILERMI